MSFKRDGDDVDLLRSLKHRRVCELLSNHIPDDEAMLLKNGRLTCLICSHRPIFDTLSMLAIHRKGKKHVNELGKFLLHKRQEDLKKLKAEQARFLVTGLVVESPVPPPQSKKLLVSQVSYSGCSKRRFGLQRKTTLDIQIISKEKEMNGVVTKSNELPSASAQVRRYLKGLWKKKPLEKTVERCRENYGMAQAVAASPKTLPEITVEETAVAGQQQEVGEDEATRKKKEYELKLRMSGWIKDSDGKWVKDPSVEFDSDEDEPPISPD